MNMAFALILACFGWLASLSFAQLKDLNTSAAVDLMLPLSFDDSSENDLQVRSAEWMFYGPIDHLFDGRLNVAGHKDDGEFVFDVHEAHIGSSKLIPRSRFKAGKFLLGVGRLNPVHQHDWPFVMAPKVHRRFFNPGASSLRAESTADTGLEFSWLAPTEQFLDVTLGLTNNRCYGHCHDEGPRPPRPLYYIRPTTFFAVGSNADLLFGLNHLSRVNAAKVQVDLWGFDATLKQRQGSILRWLVQTEWYLQIQKKTAIRDVEQAGFYIFSQYGLTPHWSLGLRLDGFSELNMKFVTEGTKRRNFDYGITPQITYRASEFSQVRLAYSHEVETLEGVADARDRQVQLQMVFLLGAHPSHDF